MSKDRFRIPSTWEAPFWRAVKYFFITFLVGYGSGYIATRVFNFDWMIVNFHLQNLWVLAPETVIVVGAVHFWNWSRKSEKKKRQQQAREQLQQLMKEAGGELKK